MRKQRGLYPAKRMKSVFLVFCEGGTEDVYLTFLKNMFRSPFKIISQVEGGCISQRLIEVRRRELKISDNEVVRVFLMYDMDVSSVSERLMTCKAELLLSNPCIELWYLLHCREQGSQISTERVLRALVDSGGVWSQYRKASLSDTQKKFLMENLSVAVARAKRLEEMKNPSSGIYKLIEALSQEKTLL